MAAFQIAVCALALFAFVQVSSACGVGYPLCGYNGGCGGFGAYGCGCGCDPLLVDVDTYCVPTCGCGYVGCGGYGAYGLGGYGGCGNYGGCGCGCGGCGGYGCGCGGCGCGCGGCGCGCGCEPIVEVKTVQCLPVIDPYIELCGCGCGYGGIGGFGNYGCGCGYGGGLF